MDISHPVARTAFYCCVIRADDAASATPVCGDRFAARFVDADVRRDLAPVLALRPPAASNVARHRLLDDELRARLATNPQRRVILIGAGFDTRAFRLTGGRWFELDDPPLVAFKESRLPAAEAPNALTRTAVAFDMGTPDDYLGPLAGQDEAVVVLEGVSMYLSDAALSALAATLRRLLPNATILCDLMSPMFARTFSRALRARLADMGAVFGARVGHPRVRFEQAGYRCVRTWSIPGRAAEAGTVAIPGWMLATFLRTLRDGYRLFEFVPR